MSNARLLEVGSQRAPSLHLPLQSLMNYMSSVSSARVTIGCGIVKDLPPKDRMRLARNKGLCFNCLRRGHMIGACSSKRTCSVGGCTRKHNKLLHMTEPDGGTQNSLL